MKRLIKCMCLLLVCMSVLVIPVSAESRSMEASSYFFRTSAYLNELSGTSFEVYFEVTAVDGMDKLGASVIKVQRSEDDENWETVHTRKKGSYTGMAASDTGDHNYSFTYTGTSGYYYRAYVEFYAKKDNGEAFLDYYTESIHLSTK